MIHPLRQDLSREELEAELALCREAFEINKELIAEWPNMDTRKVRRENAELMVGYILPIKQRLNQMP